MCVFAFCIFFFLILVKYQMLNYIRKFVKYRQLYGHIYLQYNFIINKKYDEMTVEKPENLLIV